GISIPFPWGDVSAVYDINNNGTTQPASVAGSHDYTEIEAAAQRDTFLAEVRPPELCGIYSNCYRQVIDDHHTCGICLCRRGAYEHSRTTMPACGCVFHSCCVRSLVRRARY
ncbi:unnamed protein product, partial [Ectocarpus fasciculatus]